jgi:hypothetical protein
MTQELGLARLKQVLRRFLNHPLVLVLAQVPPLPCCQNPLLKAPKP